MKILKLSLIFIVVISVIFTVSCSEPSVTGSNNDQCAVYSGLIADFETSHTAKDFAITVDYINLKYDSAGIALTVTNPDDKIASLDKVYDIEKLHEGHWDSCKTEEPTFSANESGIPEKGTSSITYDWGKCFDLKEPGTYRFKTNIFRDATDKREKIELFIEFTVSYDSAVASLQSYEISEGTAIINIDWKNNSESTVYLTDVYTVEVFCNGEWIECTKTDIEFPPALFSVAPGESALKRYVIEEKYLLEYYGQHRVFVEYAIGSGEESETRCALIEFFIPFEIDTIE